MNKAYERINWENYPSENTALDEINLNKMDSALDEIDKRVVAHETTKLDLATANLMVKNVSFNERSGIFTITYLNGSTKELDTKLEKIATNFVYDEERQKIILTLIDGTTQEIDMSALITQYEFENSAYISFTVVNGKVKAEIINGSITADKLQPNFLADVTLQANSAKTSEQNAKVSEENAKQSEINAKNYADSAEPVASTAQGLNPTLENSTGAPIISFKGDGATEQQTYTGKNKCPNETITIDDGTVATIDVSLKANTTYTFQCETLSGELTNDSATIGFRLWDANGGLIEAPAYMASKLVGSNPPTFMQTDDVAKISVAYNGYSGTLTGVQIHEGFGRSEYEPYVGGTASPNPSYPQDIYGVGESRNLYDESTYPLTLNKYLNIENGNMADSTSNNYYATVDYVPFEYTGSIAKSEKVDICFYDENKVFLDGYSNATKVIKVPNGTKFIRLDVHKDYKDVLQIEKGTKATPYKAYGKHSLSVKSTGACIFGGLAFAQAIVDNFNGTLNESEKTVLFYTSNDLAGKAIKEGGFKENTQYTFILKGMCTNSSYKYSNLRVVYTDGTSSGNIPFETAGSVSTIKYTSSSGKTVDSIKFIYGAGGTIFNYEECGIFEGAITADEFEPYTETTADIPLSSPLYEGDYIRYNMDGIGEESHKMKAVVFDGSESGWLKSNLANINVYYIAIPNAKYAEADDNKGEVEGSCTHFNMVESYLQSAHTAGVGSCGFGVVSALHQTMIGFNTDFATLEEWTAWLAENKPKVVYERAEEEVTPLTAEQIEAFEKLRTFDGTTHVTCEAECEIQYFCDSVSGKAVAMVASKANTSAELPIGSVIMIEEQNTEKPKYGTWHYLFTQTIVGEKGGTPRAVIVKLYQRAE